MIPSLRNTLTLRKEKDLHVWVVRCKFNSGMKGIKKYVRDGIKIYVYRENEFDEVAKSFCVYGRFKAVMGIMEMTAGANTLILVCLNLHLSLPYDVLPSRKAAIQGLPVSEPEFSIIAT